MGMSFNYTISNSVTCKCYSFYQRVNHPQDQCLLSAWSLLEGPLVGGTLTLWLHLALCAQLFAL